MKIAKIIKIETQMILRLVIIYSISLMRITVDYTEAVIIVIGRYGISCYWLLRDSMGLANPLVERRRRHAGPWFPEGECFPRGNITSNSNG
jgi:hypothetical protein